ncbi:6031_t:CDS:1, partial [Acaulospora colombiana]
MTTLQTYDMLQGEVFPFENSSVPQPLLQQTILSQSTQTLESIN